jgi:hypothetical protein
MRQALSILLMASLLATGAIVLMRNQEAQPHTVAPAAPDGPSRSHDPRAPGTDLEDEVEAVRTVAAEEAPSQTALSEPSHLTHFSISTDTLEVIDGEVKLGGVILNEENMRELTLGSFEKLRVRLQEAAVEAQLEALKATRAAKTGIVHSEEDYTAFNLESTGAVFLHQRVKSSDGSTRMQYLELPQEYSIAASAYASTIETMDSTPVFREFISKTLSDFENRLGLTPGEFNIETGPLGMQYTYWGTDGRMLGQLTF